MSILTIEITDKHLKLLKYLKINTDKNNIVLSVEPIDDDIPITNDDKYSYIDLVLNGVPKDYDPLTSDKPIEYSDEQKSEWDKLYSELPLCLEVLLYNGNFETGIFKTKYHVKDWKKIG